MSTKKQIQIETKFKDIPPKPKIFAEVVPDRLGDAIHRIADNMMKWHPNEPDVNFITQPTAQNHDFIVTYAIGQGQVDQIKAANKPYIIWQLCLKTTEHPDEEWWKPIWKDALMVASYFDLSIAGDPDYNYLHTPIGYDPTVFTPRKPDIDKPLYDAVVLGYVDAPVGEVIGDVVKVFDKPVHVGGQIGGVGYNLNPKYIRASQISDQQLARLYRSTKYVAAMRYSEGFELPALEGLASGAIPIMFDLPDYRRWFDGFAIFIDPNLNVEEQLIAIREGEIKDPEIDQEDLHQFLMGMTWEYLMKSFWRSFYGTVEYVYN